jgi:Tol biopolymer transport system component
MKKRNRKILLVLIACSLFCYKTTGAFENSWAIYKNLDLSPDESKVVFERCNIFEEKGCDDSVSGNDICIVDITSANLEHITKEAGSVRWFSPDKSKMFFTMHGGIYLVDLETKAPLKRLPKSGSIVQLSWSPNSKEFLLTTGADSSFPGKATLINAETFEETVLDSHLVSAELPFQWFSDGSGFLYSIAKPFPEIYLLNLWVMTNGLLASGDPGERIAYLKTSPDDQKMLYKYKDSYKIQYLDLLAERRLGRPVMRRIICREVDLPAWAYDEFNEALWSKDREDVRNRMDYVLLQSNIGAPFRIGNIQVLWSPDGQKVLIKGKDQIWIYDLAEDKFTPLWRDTSSIITDVVFDPNQPRVFLLIFGWEDLDGSKDFNRYTEGYTNLCVLDLNGGSPKTIVERTDLDNHLTFSSDGKLLAFEKNRNIWLLSLDNLVAQQLTPSSGRNAQWLKDDKRILFKSGGKLYAYEEYGSLYTIDIDGKNLKRLTMDKAMQPIWLNNTEIAVKSEGKYWKVSLDKVGVTEMNAAPKKTPRVRGKKYEVYINEFASGFSSIKVTEIWAKEIATSKSWKIVEAIKNW